MEKMDLGYNPCNTFCGCETIGNAFDPNDHEITTKLYVYIFVIVLTIIASIKISMQWFTFKDYYPFKEKSPILCMMMIFSMAVQLIFYPVIYSVNYFTNMFYLPETKSKFRAIQVGFQFTVYLIYLLRCLRISYAHETQSSRRKSLSWKIFQNQEILAACVIVVGIIRALPVFFDPYSNQNNYNFALAIQIAVIQDSVPYHQYQFIIRNLVWSFIWQVLLIYCLWLQKNVNYRYSMKEELISVLATAQITGIIYIIVLAFTLNQFSTLNTICNKSEYFPMTQFWKLFNMIVAFVVSILLPLRKRKIYHVLLPTGPHYGFVKTMRNFLMEKEFLRVFSKYLEFLDEQQGTKNNTKILNFWQELILIKVGRHQKYSQSQEQRNEGIMSLITQVEQDALKEQQELINNLKGTINGLEDSMIQNQLTKIRREKYRQSINEKVDELQQIALEKLNSIYQQKYCYTESYFNLKQIMNDYKRVNLNLILLNMALIVDSENQFT